MVARAHLIHVRAGLEQRYSGRHVAFAGGEEQRGQSTLVAIQIVTSTNSTAATACTSAPKPKYRPAVVVAHRRRTLGEERLYLRTRYFGCALAGGRRWWVACSYPYTSVISFPSLHGRPKNVIPAGSAFPRVYPIGTVIAGKPVVGENN